MPDLDHLIPGQRFLKWIFAGLPSLALVAAGTMKILQPPEMMQGMGAMPITPDSLFRLGILNLLIVVLYWIPRTAFLGTILSTAYLGGATAIDLLVMKNPPVAAVVLGVLFWIGYGMRFPRVMASAGLLPDAGKPLTP
ncbi:MAG: DoxX family protein [Bryobacteraceae bacterium]